MKPPLHLRTFQIGAPPKRGEGLRIGTTRRPPRGVPRARWKRDGYFDVWFPVVAPSAALLGRTRDRDFANPAVRRRFFEAYRRELRRPPAKHAVALLRRWHSGRRLRSAASALTRRGVIGRCSGPRSRGWRNGRHCERSNTCRT